MNDTITHELLEMFPGVTPRQVAAFVLQAEQRIGEGVSSEQDIIAAIRRHRQSFRALFGPDQPNWPALWAEIPVRRTSGQASQVSRRLMAEAEWKRLSEAERREVIEPAMAKFNRGLRDGGACPEYFLRLQPAVESQGLPFLAYPYMIARLKARGELRDGEDES